MLRQKTTDYLTIFSRQIGYLMNKGQSAEEARTNLGNSIPEELSNEYRMFEELFKHTDKQSDSSLIGLGSTPTILKLNKAIRENGGTPELSIKRLSEFLHFIAEINRIYWSGILGILFYSGSVILLMNIVLVIFSIFVIPQFDELFADMGGGLPMLTQMISTLGGSVTTVTLILSLAVTVVFSVIAIKVKDNLRRGRPLKGFMEYVPGFAGLCERYNILLLLSLADVMIQSGVSADTALTEAGKIAGSNRTGWKSIANNNNTSKVRWYSGISDSIAMARSLGTLEEEISYLSEDVNSNLVVALSKVRSELTIIVQVVVGIIIATVVIGLYLPIFKLGSLV